ncbi:MULTISPECIES: SpoIID/LytB domain-containing protein [Pelosinus]|uniref:SpoIID/LytB domain protein n=1 Tax=Pelosinus fermentans B4 TaxID=1149862 RepID=I9B3A0_9FIRM|nr:MULTISPECIES: SpoIID/LytB domain-containing protein [Pelosinus]EIW19622.1 SpoIID/LytB domain protein [Pelosinus fermentans B4]EIW24644.1 SpoIID/LytB domain protein [Pelosinus fermentans A11]OAM96075.1 SpoIID/LytB domain protein [Pelosinus fermentans DSM 17108]SDR36089.1 stage II sporulation protein D [Pelosinus fermentans]
MENKHKFMILMFLIGILIMTGACSFLQSPAPKPDPEVVEAPSPEVPVPETVQPIPGVETLDVNKYNIEPTITVWIADKGYVDRMLLEKYLEGVVAREMHNDWPIEALAAQAITSRTLTLHAMEAGTIMRLHRADVSTAKEELQAYAPELVNDNVREAVRRTRGEVLTYAGGLINAIYSSCNGQIAATKEESFPEEIPTPTPYFQPITDQCFQYAPEKEKSWTVKIPGAEVAAAVGYSGNPKDIRILEKGPSGRILYIGAGDKKVYGSDFRKKVGYDRLRSTLITEMNYDGESFTFKGMGWGNGVGLCQWGAYTFAQEGHKAEDIVKTYYVGTEVTKLWQ